jgi:TonB-linked SusC/RagA family outer membrane protein
MKKVNVSHRTFYLKAGSEKSFRIPVLIIFLLLLSSYNAFCNTAEFQQPIKISGMVTDINGNPLPGVTIIAKGTTSGTITGSDGKFQLEISAETKFLQVSFIGMKTQEVAVDASTSLTVIMEEESIGLEEVFITGYGTRTRKEVTGSISQVSGKDMKISPAVNLSGTLAGRMTGVFVNQRNGEPGRDEATILIRGINTISGSTPLYVIDGVADRDDISRLDPEDIATVTVLKDASAAIYGARAANGVILVTTKRGVEGKPTISYSYNQGFVKPTRLPEMADAGSYAAALYDAEDVWSGGTGSHQYSEEDIRKFEDGSDPLGHPNTNWFDDFFKQTSLQNRQNLSMSGGSKAVKYFLSLGSINQDGLYENTNSGYKQYNFRANIDATITDNLKLGFDVNGRKEKGMWPGVDQWWVFWMAMRQAPTELSTFPNGEYSAGLANLNPLAMVGESGYQRSDRDIYNGTISFDYKIPKIAGLSVDGFAAVDLVNNFNKNFFTPWYFSTWDQATDTYERYLSTTLGAYPTLYESTAKGTSVTLNLKLKYARIFNNHNLSGFIAYEQNKGNGDDFSTSRGQFDSQMIDQLFAGTSDKSYYDNTGSAYQTARQNYFGRLSYGYADKYLLDFNLRYDGSMNFPEDQRFGLFPGLSVGWRISEENFFSKIEFINDLKIRASVGKLGNDRIPSFSYMSKYGFGNNYVLGGKDVSGITETGVAIPNVTWETTTVKNLGLDLTFLKNKVYLEIDAFKNKTTGMLISRTLAIPSYAGFQPPPENAGTMENKGAEMSLNYFDQFGQLGIRVGGNISFSKNKVLYLDEVINPDAPWQAQTGYKFDRRLVFDEIGIYRTQSDLDKYPGIWGSTPEFGDLIYRDVDNNGEVNGLDMIPIELNSTPEVVFGFNFGLTYNNFDLTAFFQGQARANQPVGYRFDGSGNVDQVQLSNRYSDTNPNGTYPRVGVPNNIWMYTNSTFWLQNASFLRLKTLELGYNFPNSLLSKIGMKDLRLYISGYNLFTISQIKVQDPEVTSNDGGQHPQTRIYNIGIRITL